MNREPPEGMHTIVFNNEPVGYVPAVADLVERAKLGEELLKKLGLWKDKSKARAMFEQAQVFGHVAARIYREDISKLPRDPKGICPFVVNSAFCAEMYLKCLLELSEVLPAPTHTLSVLFKALPNRLKDRINKNCTAIELQYVKQGMLFKEHLKNLNTAFVDWRYIYEKETLQVNLPQIILVLRVLFDVTVHELGAKELGQVKPTSEGL